MFYEWFGFVLIGFIALCFVAFYGVIFGIILTVLWWCRWIIVLLSATYLCLAYGSNHMSKPLFNVIAPVYRDLTPPPKITPPEYHPQKKEEVLKEGEWTVSDTKPSSWNISDSELDQQFQEMKEKENKSS